MSEESNMLSLEALEKVVGGSDPSRMTAEERQTNDQLFQAALEAKSKLSRGEITNEEYRLIPQEHYNFSMMLHEKYDRFNRHDPFHA